MIRFITASYTDTEDTTMLARQIAKFTAAGGNRSVLFTKSTLFEDIQNTDTDITVINNKDSIPDNAEILVSDLGNISQQVVKTSDADRIYLVVNGADTDAETLSKKFTAQGYDCSIVLYNTNDMSDYKELGQKIIRVGRIRKDCCQYEIKMDLDLLSHQKGFTVPAPTESFEYDMINAPEKDDKEETISKSKRPEKIERDGVDIVGSLLSVKDRLSDVAGSAADGMSDFMQTIKDKKEDRELKKADREDENSGRSDRPARSRKEKLPDIEKESKKTDWTLAAARTENEAKSTARFLSFVNLGLGIVIILLAINTAFSFRASRHRPVTLAELVKTEYPAKYETDGLSIEDYSGISKNRKVAVIIGDDEFVKPYSKTFENLRKKDAVETKKYEITVSFSKNPLIQWAFGDLHFVHHSAFGEGDFNKKEVAEIMAYSRKWYTKKVYDLFRFNDRDTININNPPDSMLRETDR